MDLEKLCGFSVVWLRGLQGQEMTLMVFQMSFQHDDLDDLHLYGREFRTGPPFQDNPCNPDRLTLFVVNIPQYARGFRFLGFALQVWHTIAWI